MTVKRMSSNAARKLAKSIEAEYHDVWRRTLKGKHCQAWNLERLTKAHERKAGLPRHWQEYLFGVSNTLYHCHQQHLEFSYVVEGVRRFISDPVYRAYDPRLIDTETGFFAYRSDVNRTW